MAHANQKITAPVSFADVNAVLGSNKTDLGRLCTLSNINVWAKYKPVVNNGKFYTSQFDFTNNRWKNDTDCDWWHGSANDSIGGIKPKNVTIVCDASHLAELIALYDGGMNGWTYTAPSGGALSPYRLTDYADYNHNAPAPIQGITMTEKIPQSGRLHVSALITPKPEPPNDYCDSLTLEDFSSDAFDTLYFGILVMQNTTPKLVATVTTAGETEINRNFSGSGEILPVGTYQAYPLFSSREMFTSAFNGQSTKFYTCPMCNPMTFQIVQDGSQANVTIEYTADLTSTNRAQFQVNNLESQSIFQLQYVFTASSTRPDSGWANWNDSQSSVTVAANSSSGFMTKTYTGYSYIHIKFYFNSGWFYTYAHIIPFTPPSNQTQ
jgi:hypothetical protein